MADRLRTCRMAVRKKPAMSHSLSFNDQSYRIDLLGVLLALVEGGGGAVGGATHASRCQDDGT